MNLLEIGKILRPHGIKGAVKVESYLDEDYKKFKKVFISNKKIEAKITKVQPLNNGALSICFDAIPDIDTAESFRNQSIYIDRNDYADFEDKLYLSDLINKPVLNENDEEIGKMADYDDYGASVILTIRCGSVSYQIPYVDEFISFNRGKDAFVIEQQKFEDLRV